MKAIVNTGPGELMLSEWLTPVPGPGEVRVRTAACGICATDLEMIAGWQRTGFPSIPGHEWSGLVDEVGAGVDPAWLGKPCVADNVLADGGEVGFEHPGGYGQYLITSAQNLFELPVAFPLTTAVLIEPLAVCMRAVKRMRIENRRSALILGDGPMGLLMLMLLRRAGIEEIMLVGGRRGRLALAKQLGVNVALDFREPGDGLVSLLRDAVPQGFANVVEASGSVDGARTAVASAARGGHVLVLGDYREAHADFRWNDLLHREVELIGSNASAGGWSEAVSTAISGELPLERLITKVFPVSAFWEPLSLLRGQGEDVVKLVLDWEDGKQLV